MESPHESKVWYKKKRYIIPAGLLGLLLFFNSNEATTSESIKPIQLQADAVIPSSFNYPKSEAVQKPVQTQNCHPSYSGCLNPNASDYDCAGGSGNGPYYTGAVRVIGYDEYGLDRDQDGWGCE